MIDNVIQVSDNNSWGPTGSTDYGSYLAIRNTKLPDNFRDVPAILYGCPSLLRSTKLDIERRCK